MPDTILSVLPSLFVLGLVALAALRFAVHRQSPPENAAERLTASRALAITTLVQGIHFAEELATGFHEKFPALLGLPAMPLSFFVGFNLLWLGVWLASIPSLRQAHRTAFFAAWFLALAGALNGIAHPLLAVAAGGYFPGLVTSPFIGIAGCWLWRTLLRASQPKLPTG